jgi:hypothetical protein
VSATQRLAQHVQDGIVVALDDAASYERQDRGISAVNFFIVAPPLFVTTPDRPDPVKQPRRGALMPAILTEIGSITLAAEHDLLLSPDGQAAAAAGIASALRAYLADRRMAARFDGLLPGGSAGTLPSPFDGDGPPFWAPRLSPSDLAAGLPIRLTNTGSAAWPDGLRVLAGSEPATEPYLRQAPATLTEVAVEIPPLAPGESVVVRLALDTAATDGETLWITLANGDATFADLGSAALQLTMSGP